MVTAAQMAVDLIHADGHGLADQRRLGGAGTLAIPWRIAFHPMGLAEEQTIAVKHAEEIVMMMRVFLIAGDGEIVVLSIVAVILHLAGVEVMTANLRVSLELLLLMSAPVPLLSSRARGPVQRLKH